SHHQSHISLYHAHIHHRHLHSFPTRRSSDLGRVCKLTMNPRHSSIRLFRKAASELLCKHALVDVGPDRTQQDGEIGTASFRQNADRKSTRLNSSHSQISYAVFCLKKKKQRKK